MLLHNSRRSAAAIGLDIISTHAKLMLSFRPLMSRASFSRSVDIGVTGRVSTSSQARVAPAIVGAVAAGDLTPSEASEIEPGG
jgi:hypothetical protein